MKASASRVVEGPTFDAREFIAAHEWRFAKTVPMIPHSYVVREQVDRDAFDAFERLIAQRGYRESWGGFVNVYLKIDGWKYWVTDNILNREVQFPRHPKDTVRPARHSTRFESTRTGSVALVHDITTGDLPDEFAACDVLYAELPTKTEMRATFVDLLDAVARIVEEFRFPTVLVGSPGTLESLPDPDEGQGIILHDGSAVAAGFWRCSTPWPGRRRPTDLGLIRGLAQTYGRVGDFCCGYGLAGRVFLQAGGSFVMSDIDPACIGCVAEKADQWVDEEWL